VRIAFMGTAPAFQISNLPASGAAALAVYVAIGALIGVVSVWVTELISWLEHQFARIPGPWLFHPAIGGIVVGLIGWKLPHTMGPGYDTIEDILTGRMAGSALLFFFVFKLISWSCSVGSGTSGGTLAPMFAMGGCLGGAAAGGVAYLFPQLGVNPQVAALVGMAAIFTGASRAFLASVTLAFETTHQFEGALPLLPGC
jgi:CIC family chloride channel protein